MKKDVNSKCISVMLTLNAFLCVYACLCLRALGKIHSTIQCMYACACAYVCISSLQYFDMIKHKNMAYLKLTFTAILHHIPFLQEILLTLVRPGFFPFQGPRDPPMISGITQGSPMKLCTVIVLLKAYQITKGNFQTSG